MKIFASIILLCLGACAPKAIIARPISEQAAVMQGAVKVAAKQVDKVERSTVQVSDNVQSLKDEIERSQAEAERQRQAGVATQRELEANARSWAGARLKAEFLEATASTLRIDTSDLRSAITTAQIETEKMRTQASESDATAKKLQDRIVSMTPNYELGKTVRGMFWSLVIGGVLIVVAFIVLIVMNRAARTAASVATHGIIPS